MYNFLVYFVFLLSVPTFAKVRSRIVGGHEAPLAFGLFHASLQNWSGSHVCGGAIVSKWHVITAAHCIYNARPEHIKVVVGTTDLNKGGIKYDAASINIYRAFNYSAKVNDIALLKVKKQFDLHYVKIILMHEESLLEREMVFISGFGAQMINEESSSKMQVLMLPVFNQDTCRYAMRYTREVTDGMFCTFTQIGQGTCNGDSGSPIIKDDKLVGLVSWGIPCAVGFPDVHTRVAPYIEWIRSEIKNDICKISAQAKD